MDNELFYIGIAISLLVAAGFVLFGIIAGYPSAHWIGGKMADFLSCTPLDRFTKPQPAYGLATSKPVSGELEGAMELFEEMLLDHPNDKKLYILMLEIALGPMNLPSYGDDILQRGMRNLKEKADRSAILRFSELLRSGDLKPYKYLIGV